MPGSPQDRRLLSRSRHRVKGQAQLGPRKKPGLYQAFPLLHAPGGRAWEGVVVPLVSSYLITHRLTPLQDLPSAPSPLPIRKPNINPVHPFKTSTLSSGSPSLHSPSPSLRQPSPLSAGNQSLPSRPIQTSPNSSRVPPSFGVGSKQSPSSIEGRSEGEDTSPKLPPRKRYSSSFGHRYAAAGGGGGSVGSAGSGERAEVSLTPLFYTLSPRIAHVMHSIYK